MMFNGYSQINISNDVNFSINIMIKTYQQAWSLCIVQTCVTTETHIVIRHSVYEPRLHIRIFLSSWVPVAVHAFL